MLNYLTVDVNHTATALMLHMLFITTIFFVFIVHIISSI